MAPVPPQRKSNILVTGYGAFKSAPVLNPSWEAVKTLEGLQSNGYRIVPRLMTVAYEFVSANLPPLIAEFEPAAIIHVGQGLPNTINLETIAHPQGYVHPDVENQMAPEGTVILPPPADGSPFPSPLRTILDNEALRDAMRAKGWDICNVSTDAGRYLCEYIFYSSLYLTRESPVPVLFLHIPAPGAPYSQEQLDIAVRDLVSLVAATLEAGALSGA
ncbi:uncharacterized protein BJ171DRAFT_601756 [Polychytrium aggregatum]|uniref:uncharacterized protein n=1 Tax=Polychytrium aggregatum TaxID=110093 RepID=UPI0022FE42F3|nr:uncharacterized protein BJ171DRAFT_601756 [Polychytrium aggregatum]KAI9199610.1 hypothetical protein BJ171DRAFT_601756 [Polychytrium aggregatum]